jgi:hypothetical protein
LDRYEKWGKGESKLGRVMSMGYKVRTSYIADRCHRRHGDLRYFVSDEVHDWFKGIDPDYRFKVSLVITISTGVRRDLADRCLLKFRDNTLATMFKLAWGGEA